jgi:hypothetical protein
MMEESSEMLTFQIHIFLFEFQLFSLRNSKFMVKTLVTAKIISGRFNDYSIIKSVCIGKTINILKES